MDAKSGKSVSVISATTGQKKRVKQSSTKPTAPPQVIATEVYSWGSD